MKLSTIKQVIFLILFCLLATNVDALQAQKSSAVTSKIKSEELLQKADYAYKNLKFYIAADYYETYLKNSIYLQTEVLTKLADCYWQMREYDNALTVYEVLFPDEYQDASQNDRHRIGELYARFGQYKKASIWLKNVKGYELKAKVYSVNNELNEMKKDSMNWKLGFLNVNTTYREFSPFYFNNTLFFTSNKPLLVKSKAFSWDGDNYAHLWKIPISQVDSISLTEIDVSALNNKLSKYKSNKLVGIYECGDNKSSKNVLSFLINKPYLNADLNSIGTLVKGLDKILFNAGAISIDENNHFYFSANYEKADKKDVNRICIMEGIYTSEGITSVKKMPFGDFGSYSLMHPAINQNGTFLVLSSDKPNGEGKFDLYYSKRSDISQPWQNLKAFGSKINTIGNEVFPNITPNGLLYYSSDGMPGLGGLDIFSISLEDALAGNVEPKHISYPINSSADDFGWTQLDSTGMKGFFTSDRLNNNDNLYSFYYKSNFAPKYPRKSFIEGLVLEKNSNNPIEGATIFLYNVKEDSVYVTKSDINGRYHIPINSTSKVIVKAVDKKYINDCLSTDIVFYTYPKDSIQTAPRELLLDKFKIGFVWKLSNIQYNFDKWDIRPDARPKLDSLVVFLKNHPITVELGSHTDSRGSSTSNKTLSQLRAESVVAYLIQHGIDSRRITAKGYGESQLLNRCADGIPCSEEEHQVNRRTEVKVTGYTINQKEPEKINTDIFIDGDKIPRKLLPSGFFDDCK